MNWSEIRVGDVIFLDTGGMMYEIVDVFLGVKNGRSVWFRLTHSVLIEGSSLPLNSPIASNFTVMRGKEQLWPR